MTIFISLAFVLSPFMSCQVKVRPDHRPRVSEGDVGLARGVRGMCGRGTLEGISRSTHQNFTQNMHGYLPMSELVNPWGVEWVFIGTTLKIDPIWLSVFD